MDSPCHHGQAGPAHGPDCILAHKTAPETQQPDVLRFYYANIGDKFPFAGFHSAQVAAALIQFLLLIHNHRPSPGSPTQITLPRVQRSQQNQWKFSQDVRVQEVSPFKGSEILPPVCPGYKKNKFHDEDSQTLAQSAQRGCTVSVPAGFQNLVGQSPKKPFEFMSSWLTLL